MPGSDYRLLLRRPGYLRFFAVVAAARTTGAMFSVAGVLLVLERTGSLTLAGLVVAAATLPGVVTGPFLGAWLDVTHSRRRLLVLDRLLTIAALGALLALAGHSADWLLVLVALAYGATSPLSSGAFASVLPEAAGPELVEAAYTFESTSVNTAFIIGPALAGLLAGAAGAATAIELQIVVGAILALLIAGDETYELRPAHHPQPARVRAAVADGLSSLRQIAALRWNAVAGAIYVMAWSAMVVGFPAYAISVGASAHTSGYMWAALAFGSMISAFAFRVPALRLQPRLLICGSFCAIAASIAAWPLAGSLAAALALVLLTGLLEGPSFVALMSVRQRLAPPQLRGQIFTTVSSLNLAADAAGSAGAGPFHAAFGTRSTLLAAGALVALAGLVALGTRFDSAGVQAGAPIDTAA